MKRLPGLDFLRFYAALSVLMYHIGAEANVDRGIADVFNVLFLNGGDAVVLFFVLSGFLITHLLLNEQARTGTVDRAGFYRRRILRIFPLYYTVVFIGLVVFPLLFGASADRMPPQTPLAWIAFLFFLQNFQGVIYWNNVLGHLWSIAVEEQFYLAYPQLFRRFSLLKLFSVVILVFGGYALLAEASGQYELRLLANALRFDAIALGGFGALVVHRYPLTRRALYHPLMQAFAAFTVVMAIVADIGGAAYGITIAAAFMIVIVNAATNPRSFLRFRCPQILGDLTYPLYMLHPFVIYGVNVALFAAPMSTGDSLLFAGVVTALSFACALASYRWLETPFLRLKERRRQSAALVTSPSN